MLRALAVPAVLLTAALAGCFGAEEPVEGAAQTPLTNATENLTAPLPEAVSLAVATSGIYPLNPGFAPATLEAKEGANVTITLANEDPNPIARHNWVLEGVSGAETEAVGTGMDATVSFIAPAAGEYKFFCSVGDHRSRGMEGTLTVTA